MAGNPQIAQGTLNRIRGSLVVPSLPALNVTSSFLGKQGIIVSFQSSVTAQIETMTGTVTSPMPYQMISVSVTLLKTQALASSWEAQRQLLSTIGDITVTPDTSILPLYTFNNCAIENVGQLSFNGEDPGYGLTISGYYQINSSLWNLV